METKLAATFLKVAELGNVTRSAEQLGYSQAAVTFQIQQLEAELGVRLLDRIGRGIELTDAGLAFIPYAKALLDASNAADEFAMDIEDPSGSIIMECSSSLTVGKLSSQIVKFRKLYPRIKLTVRSSDNVDTMIGGLRENLIDFVFMTNRHSEFDGCKKIAEVKEEFVIATHPGDPLVKRKNVKLANVFDKEFVSSFIVSDRDISYINSFEKSLREMGIVIEPMLDFSSTSAIANIIKRGYGRSLLPKYLIDEDIKKGDLCTIDTEIPDLDIWSQLYCNENKWVNPQMRAFMEFMEQEITA